MTTCTLEQWQPNFSYIHIRELYNISISVDETVEILFDVVCLWKVYYVRFVCQLYDGRRSSRLS